MYLIISPVQPEPFTEFYLLGPDGKAGNYPTNLIEGQQGKVIIGVINHEHNTTNYQLIVKKTIISLKTEYSALTITKKEITFIFTSSPPNNNLEFLLYKLPNDQNAYRSLHL